MESFDGEIDIVCSVKPSNGIVTYMNMTLHGSMGLFSSLMYCRFVEHYVDIGNYFM